MEHTKIPLETNATSPVVTSIAPDPPRPSRWLIVFLAAAVLAYIQPLRAWVAYAWNSEVHSYTLLVPFLSAYLLHLRRPHLPRPGRPAFVLAAICAIVAVVARLGWSDRHSEAPLLSHDDAI